MKLQTSLIDHVDNGDEVGRQRRKRAQQLLERSVAGFDDLTLHDVLTSVVAATEESDGKVDVEQFLVERGHAWQTVEMIQACLPFVERHISSDPAPRS